MSLGRRDAATPGLRSNRVGGPLADLGDQVGRWVVFERDEPGGIADDEPKELRTVLDDVWANRPPRSSGAA